MDLNPSAEEVAFQQAVRGWLEANLPEGWGTPAFRMPRTDRDKVGFARAWQRKLHEGGWAGLTWPKEFGGRGASVVESLIWGEEYARAQAPDTVNISVGTSLVGPTLIAKGTPEQQRRFLPRILTGEEIWCQGFSEPNAGSDLAALRTRGELKDDEIVVTGQKIWTSFAKHADWCILIVRTDPGSQRHKGLSFLLCPMDLPGIGVRPLKEMTGEAWFNEVFFDQVRVPRQNVVGELGKGWDVVMATLMHERTATAGHIRIASIMQALVDLVQRVSYRGRPASKDLRVRQRLAQLVIEAATLRYTCYRNVTRIQQRGVPGPEGSTTKALGSEIEQRMMQLVSEVLGPYGLLEHGSPRAIDDGRWAHDLLWARAGTIYAGTSEIQRNIIAERVLGLPRG